MKYLITALILIAAWSNQAVSDDIDLYIKNTTSTVQRPSVLIILDNSGSMDDDITGASVSGGNVNNVQTKSYLARKIIIDLINNNPSVDFALQIFNTNNNSDRYGNNDGQQGDGDGDDGGRIIYGINDLSIAANKTSLIRLLDSDDDNDDLDYTNLAASHTPLCETLYETYRYLSGGAVLYGLQNDQSATSRPPSILTTTGSKYTSPFQDMQCNKEITIIYITDGAPTRDNNANTLVKNLTGATSKIHSSYLGRLGSWMATKNWKTLDGTTADNGSGTNISDTPEGTLLASVKIHTVGFGAVTQDTTAVNSLKFTARHGETAVTRPGFYDSPAGGKYHEASDAAALETELQAVVEEVLASSSLTSASVSANSFDRTQTSDSVYYGMFEPTTAARWQGNIKKYKIVNGVQVDANDISAVNAAGEFKETSQSFWSPTVDGNDVNKGGVAEMLRTTVTARTLLTDIGGVGALTDFNLANINGQYTTPATLTAKFNIPLAEAADVPDHVKWAMGIDVDDDDGDSSTTDIRPSVFGDPLHSKPIVINYGTGNPRIVVGTNAGVLHMFEDDAANNQVIENWAYLPNEFFKNIKPLRENVIAVDNKIYGLDGEITLHINDINNDGIVNGADTAWLFFGVRRGGRSYYALNVTNPASPRLMWYRDFNNAGFEDLGQTWSKPQVVRSAYNTDDADKLVVIFGGGYDTNKDASGPNVVNDSLGAAVYMVNARTGALIFTRATGVNNGIASSIASLDSDSDALVDRLYVGDTGGNVWRIDMPDETIAHTSIIRLANFAGTTSADDIRFFNQPAITRTYILETIETGTVLESRIVKQEVPYDAILLGSGDRATPTATDTNDMFFMIKDKYITTQQLDTLSTAIVPVTLSELYDYTDDPFENYPALTEAQEDELLNASLASGWHFDLEQTGEKSSAEAIVIDNVVYFTSYTPTADTICSVTPGDAWLYAVDLALGVKKYDWGSETNNRSGDDRILYMGSQFLGKPTLIRTPVTTTTTSIDDNGLPTTTTTTDLQGDLIIGKEVIPVGFVLQTMRTSLTLQEN